MAYMEFAGTGLAAIDATSTGSRVVLQLSGNGGGLSTQKLASNSYLPASRDPIRYRRSVTKLAGSHVSDENSSNKIEAPKTDTLAPGGKHKGPDVLLICTDNS